MDSCFAVLSLLLCLDPLRLSAPCQRARLPVCWRAFGHMSRFDWVLVAGV